MMLIPVFIKNKYTCNNILCILCNIYFNIYIPSAILQWIPNINMYRYSLLCVHCTIIIINCINHPYRPVPLKVQKSIDYSRL